MNGAAFKLFFAVTRKDTKKQKKTKNGMFF